MGLGNVCMYVCMFHIFVCLFICPFVGNKHMIDYEKLKNNYCGDNFTFLVSKSISSQEQE